MLEKALSSLDVKIGERCLHAVICDPQTMSISGLPPVTQDNFQTSIQNRHMKTDPGLLFPELLDFADFATRLRYIAQPGTLHHLDVSTLHNKTFR